MSKDTRTMLKNLYESNNTNRLMSLKSKLVSIKMEENESISNFILRIKDLKDKLGDALSQSLLTLNEMLDAYQMFIIGLVAREKVPTFDELVGYFNSDWARNPNNIK